MMKTRTHFAPFLSCAVRQSGIHPSWTTVCVRAVASAHVLGQAKWGAGETEQTRPEVGEPLVYHDVIELDPAAGLKASFWSRR